MKQFASQFQIWIRRDYPIFLLMTGLYESIDAIQNSPQLTFLLRLPKISMGPLGIAQETRQYEKKIIGVIPDEGTIKTSNLCESAGVTPQVFSKYRERLINKGLINAAGHGYVEMALPRFASVCRYYVDFE